MQQTLPSLPISQTLSQAQRISLPQLKPNVSLTLRNLKEIFSHNFTPNPSHIRVSLTISLTPNPSLNRASLNLVPNRSHRTQSCKNPWLKQKKLTFGGDDGNDEA